MNYFAGCDLVKVARIRKAAERESFLRRAFSSEELRRFSSMKNPYMSMSGAWAAKEAFSKAIGTGVRDFSLNEITVAHTELGAPYFIFSGNALSVSVGWEFSLSISHTAEYAQAFVIACRKENRHEQTADTCADVRS